jgi:choline-sulfatase
MAIKVNTQVNRNFFLMTKRKKHILWIYSDELRADALSCYGGPAGLTPNLDRLATEGVLFENAWCGSPVCVASRTAAVTGLPATRTGVYHNEASWSSFTWREPPSSWIETLAGHGYRTVNVGKIHLPKGYRSFAEHYEANGDMSAITNAVDRKELDLISPPKVRTMLGGSWPKGKPFPPEKVTETCREILRKPGDQPLFLRASYLQPHTPVTPPKELLEAWSHLEPDMRHFRTEAPNEFERKMAHNLGSDDFDPEAAKQCWICYHALVHWLDLQVGVLLETLEEQGLAEDTLVLFTADHGASLGEKGLWAKQSFSPGSQHVPLILRDPESDRAGTRDGRLSNELDLARTFAGWAGVPLEVFRQGYDVRKDEKPEAIFSIIGYGNDWSCQFPNSGSGPWSEDKGWPRRACVRTAEWRYDRNLRMNGELIGVDDPDADPCLIHVSEDPDEVTNVIADQPEQALRMESLLAEWVKDAVEQEAVRK